MRQSVTSLRETVLAKVFYLKALLRMFADWIPDCAGSGSRRPRSQGKGRIALVVVPNRCMDVPLISCSRYQVIRFRGVMRRYRFRGDVADPAAGRHIWEAGNFTCTRGIDI